MFDSLGELLIEIQLLRGEQWQEIHGQLAPDATLAGLLDRLEKLPAWWAVDSPAPALTVYQRKCIKRLATKGRLERLKRMLRRGDFLILQELGEGGIGVVYKAWDLQERRLVAVKQIKKVSLETYRRFRREARIQKRLTHPSIVCFLKLARARGDTLLVQEYIEGRTITGEVKARGPIPWPEALRWIVDVLRALAYAHRLKIIHRDIKPSNIILYAKADGQGAKLLDLGLAKCLDPTAFTQLTMKDAVTVGDALLGTFEYMAPEHWRGAEEIVPASDIYSLGCTLFYILTGGRPPFTADSLIAFCNAHTNTPPPRLTTMLPGLPESIDALVQQMLSKDPTKRGTPDRLIKQCLNLLRSSSAPPLVRSAKSASPPSRPGKAAAPAFTPTPKRPLDLPRVERGERAPVDDRFPPFVSGSAGNLAGVRTFVRAFLDSGGLVRCSLVLLFLAFALALAGAGVLWLWLHN